MKIINISLIILTLWGVIRGYSPDHRKENTPARENPQTIITPVLGTRIQFGTNLVYTASFATAWQQLRNEILREDVILQVSLPLTDALNQAAPPSLDPEHSLAMAGFVEDGIIEEIAGACQQKFGQVPDLEPYGDLKSNIICYSRLSKQIRFTHPFEKYDQPFPFLSGNRQWDVSCFGAWVVKEEPGHMEMARQVTILDYADKNDFIISLGNPGSSDKIILAQLSPASTLEGTIELVNQRIRKGHPEPLAPGDRLVIPEISLHSDHSYSELTGKHLANKSYEQYFFAAAIQHTDFELNESGASVDSDATIVLKKGPMPMILVINRPFLVLMKETGQKNPYLAVWIANGEFLHASE